MSRRHRFKFYHNYKKIIIIIIIVICTFLITTNTFLTRKRSEEGAGLHGRSKMGSIEMAQEARLWATLFEDSLTDILSLF
jgi:hypothetical protein